MQSPQPFLIRVWTNRQRSASNSDESLIPRSYLHALVSPSIRRAHALLSLT